METQAQTKTEQMITLTRDQMNNIIHACNSFTSTERKIQNVQYIRVVVENNVCTATACSGYQISTISFPVEEQPDAEIYIPLIKKIPKESKCVRLTFDGENITVDTGVQVTQMNLSDTSPMQRDFREMIPTVSPKAEVYVNAEYMKQAFASMPVGTKKHPTVCKLKLFGKEKGIIVESEGKAQIILTLPVRVGEKAGWK